MYHHPHRHNYYLHHEHHHVDYTDLNGVRHVYIHHYYPNDHHRTVVIHDSDGHPYEKKVYIVRHHHGWIIGCAIVIFLLGVILIIGCAHSKSKGGEE